MFGVIVDAALPPLPLKASALHPSGDGEIATSRVSPCSTPHCHFITVVLFYNMEGDGSPF